MTIWNLLFQLILCWWIQLDRRSRKLAVPFEFDAFLFFCWPVLMPYYFLRTRGARGLLPTAAVFAMAIMPFVIAAILAALYGPSIAFAR